MATGTVQNIFSGLRCYQFSLTKSTCYQVSVTSPSSVPLLFICRTYASGSERKPEFYFTYSGGGSSVVELSHESQFYLTKTDGVITVTQTLNSSAILSIITTADAHIALTAQ